MITLEQLRAWGADTDEALPRCLNNEGFYLKLVCRAVEEPAFDQAHALKGVTGNLALTPIDKPVREMTEHLRARREMDYQPLLSEILARRASLQALCSE